MVTERLEVRLDEERRRKLDEIAEHEQASISETVRKLIDRAYEERLRERRIEAAKRIASANIGDPLEPEELKRILNEAASPGDLH